MSSFAELLTNSFVRYRGRTALVHRGKSTSYGELNRRCELVAARLHAEGMRKGDRVVVLVQDKFDLLICHLGIILAGGVSLPLNHQFTAAELSYYLQDSGARFALAGSNEARTLESVRQSTRLELLILDAGSISEYRTRFRGSSCSLSPKDFCLMLYSSGTTGQPKGVVHSHSNLAASLLALQQCWQFTSDDILLNVLPLFHIHGLSFATHLALISGSCMILEDKFHPLRTMEKIGKSTVFMAVPPIYYAFLRREEFAREARGWGGVRLFTCGSAPIRTDTITMLEDILGCHLVNRYGMTESHVITSVPLDGHIIPGSVGLCLDGLQLRLVGKDGVELVPGGQDADQHPVVGEVRIRGENLFEHYWNRPEETRNARDEQGFFCTGDLGFQDANGQLTLVGRRSDLIITDGYNVYPSVVERVLNEHPDVLESAVVGVPDVRKGERVVCFVVLSGGASINALRGYSRERLVHYQRPVHYQVIDTLPRNTMGKVIKRALRDSFDTE